MGNSILEEKKPPGGKVVESNHFVYNESSQMTEATLCDGRATRKVCYTYDGDGNLVKEHSPTDNSTTSYQYTVEDRLEAVYTGNAYNRTLQMAAAMTATATGPTRSTITWTRTRTSPATTAPTTAATTTAPASS